MLFELLIDFAGVWESTGMLLSEEIRSLKLGRDGSTGIRSNHRALAGLLTTSYASQSSGEDSLPRHSRLIPQYAFYHRLSKNPERSSSTTAQQFLNILYSCRDSSIQTIYPRFGRIDTFPSLNGLHAWSHATISLWITSPTHLRHNDYIFDTTLIWRSAGGGVR